MCCIVFLFGIILLLTAQCTRYERQVAALTTPARSMQWSQTMRISSADYRSTVLPTVYAVELVADDYGYGHVVVQLDHGVEVARTPVYDSLEEAAAAARRLNAGETAAQWPGLGFECVA
jgi:hypothetical protein